MQGLNENDAGEAETYRVASSQTPIQIAVSGADGTTGRYRLVVSLGESD